MEDSALEERSRWSTIKKVRMAEVILATAYVLCSMNTLGRVRGGLFIINSFGSAVFMRCATTAASKMLETTAERSCKSWTQSCFIGAFLSSIMGSVAVTHAATGMTPITSYCQAFAGYSLCFILAVDVMLCSSNEPEDPMQLSIISYIRKSKK